MRGVNRLFDTPGHHFADRGVGIDLADAITLAHLFNLNG
jgi:hypothetical protein